jgi:hypothetical protein
MKKLFLVIFVFALLAFIVFILSPKESLVPGESLTREARLYKAVDAHGLSIKPISLLEDSRCPQDVVCIQAGTVRIRAEVAQENETKIAEFELLKPVILNESEVILIQVLPEAQSQKKIQDEEYQFTIHIEKK